MELRYCENCGKVLTLTGESEEINPSEHYLCTHCKARGAKPSGKKAESKAVKKGKATLDFLSSPLEEGQLDLFSGATIVKYKQKMKKRGSALLGLKVEEPLGSESLDLGGAGSSAPAKSAKKIQFHCPRCKSVLQIRPVNSPSRMECPQCKLNLFVDETGRISKSAPGAKKPPGLGLETDQPAAVKASGSDFIQKGLRATAQREAVKLQFHCLHCRVTLSVKAVKEPSRMFCPKCKGNLFIDPSGIVSKVPPRVPRARPSILPKPPARERAPAPPPPPAPKVRAPAPPVAPPVAQPIAPPIAPPIAQPVAPPAAAPAAPPAAAPAAAPAAKLEKEAVAAPKPKQARRRRSKPRIKQQMIRVTTTLPLELVEAIEGSGQAVSKVIRQIVEEKVKPLPKNLLGPM